MAPAPRHVALLRGINVGGKNKVAMRDLAAMFEAAGCADVTTYIQSGNVVFAAAARTAAAVPAAIARRLRDQLGLDVPVVLRSAAELAAAARANPFVAAGRPTEALYLLFLADAPAPARVQALDPQRSPGDEYAVRGREIYMYCPGGVARTRLTNDYFDRALATISTARNWRTVGKLVELASG